MYIVIKINYYKIKTDNIIKTNNKLTAQPPKGGWRGRALPVEWGVGWAGIYACREGAGYGEVGGVGLGRKGDTLRYGTFAS